MCISTEQGRKADNAYDAMLSTEYTVEVGGQTFTKEQFTAVQAASNGEIVGVLSGNDYTGTEAPDRVPAEV